MRYIQIPAENNRLLLVQPTDIVSEIIFPFHTVINTFQLALGIGNVTIDQIKFIKFQCDQPAFMIVFVNPHSVHNLKRLFFCEYRRPRISFFVRIVPVLMIPFQLQLDLSGLQFCLLHAEDICLHFIKKIYKTLCHTGAQPIDIP